MFFVGIDISKAKLDGCLPFDSAGSKRKSKSVANSKTRVADLLVWVAKHGIASTELRPTRLDSSLANQRRCGSVNRLKNRLS